MINLSERERKYFFIAVTTTTLVITFFVIFFWVTLSKDVEADETQIPCRGITLHDTFANQANQRYAVLCQVPSPDKRDICYILFASRGNAMDCKD